MSASLFVRDHRRTLKRSVQNERTVCGRACGIRLRLPAVVDHVVTDELWLRLAPLIPVPERRYRFPGRGRLGSKHHLITDAGGIPLAVILTGGNRNDVTQLLPLIDAIPPIRGRRGRPKRRPRQEFADRGYNHDKYRRLLRHRHITPKIARRGAPHGSGLGKLRWVVERTFSWLHNFRRLRTRYERRADIHQAMISVACSVICLRRLLKSF
jgi:transposase